MSRALVTGGSGFLGSFVADALVEAGWEVVVFDRRESPHLREGQTMVVGDLLDADALRKAAEGAAAIYHLAAAADLNTAAHQALETARTNIVGTVLALEAARQAGAERFVLASTVYVYSRAGGFYRCSKQACEAYVEEFQRQHGLDYTVLRFGSLYGPRADDSNGVHRLLRQALERGAVVHEGSPDDSREYIHVEDAARLSVEALAPEFANQHLTLSGHHPMRLRDLFTMFSEILGSEITIDYRPPSESHYRITPYAYSPRVGRKLTANRYVDMGQGLLQVVEEIHRSGEDGVNAAIVTARAGSKSIRDKNVHPVRGQPLVAYPIQAALDAEKIAAVFVSTDGESIAEASRELGCTVIERPDELGGDTVNHGDVIRHAVRWVDARHPELDNVVLLLGNTVMIDGELIDACLRELDRDPELDSVMTVWEAADDHPLRALEIVDGLLQPYGDPERRVSTERQSYPKAYYYDQGVWAFRKGCVERRDGPNPWWWMGAKSKPVVRNWVTGRDVHTKLDLGVSEWWLDHLPGVREL